MIIEITSLTFYFLLIVAISFFYIYIIIMKHNPGTNFMVIKWSTRMLFILLNLYLLFNLTKVAVYYLKELNILINRSLCIFIVSIVNILIITLLIGQYFAFDFVQILSKFDSEISEETIIESTFFINFERSMVYLNHIVCLIIPLTTVVVISYFTKEYSKSENDSNHDYVMTRTTHQTGKDFDILLGSLNPDGQNTSQIHRDSKSFNINSEETE